jgi:hypothetical protein
MNTESVFNNKGYIIPNPNYDPKTKKGRSQSPTLHVIGVNEAGGNGAADIFASNVSDAWTMGDTRKYQEYGITPNKISPNLDKELADAQSNWKKAANALAQTAVSEIGLGTALGVADLFDMIGSKVGVLDDDYKNPVSEYLEEKQKEFREYAPVYATPGVDISNGGFGDFGWWMSNVPSIASSLTLLIPSTGVTKGLSYLGKATKATSFTRKAIRATTKAIGNKSIYRWANKSSTIGKANAMTELGLNAALSRTMENYQEARGVYNDMYSEAADKLNKLTPEQYQQYIDNNPHIFKDDNGNDKVNTSNKDEVAKYVAKQAADRDFVQNYWNIGWDVLQLYALKGMFRGGKLPELGSSKAKIRRANKDMMKYADKLKGKNVAEVEEEIKTLNKNLSFGTKLGHKIEDYTYGSAMTIGAEASEGAEEAWNYISQMEGMHTGRLLLGTDAPSRWDKRAESYFTSPQLWESAFWGVLGGVVFQNVGGLFKQVGYNISKHAEDKKAAKQAETTGETKLSPSWSLFDDMPDVKRGIHSVYARQVALMDLKAKRDAIKNGKNPYDATKDIDKEEASAYEAMVTDDYITNLALQSYNNGTFGMTREYFANDNVRKGMVENGVVSEQESRQFQENVLNKLDKVKEEYEDETVRMDALSGDSERKENIPMEYIQIAATNNVRTRHNIADMTERQAALMREFEEAFANIPDGKIDKNLPYREMMDFQVQVSYLNKLEDDKREIEARHKANPNIGTQIALDNINKTIDGVKKKIAGDFSNQRASYTLFAINELLAHKRTQHKEIDADIEKIFHDLENGDAKAFGDYFGATNYNPDKETINSIIEEYKTLGDKYDNVMTNLKELGTTADSYRNAVMLGHFIGEQNNNMIATRKEFDNYMNVLNNTMNEARVKALDEAANNIVDLTEKYDNDIIDKAILANRNGQPIDAIISELEQADKDKLNEALSIINFSNQANAGVYDNIKHLMLSRIAQRVMDESKASAQTNNAVQESSTSNLNPSETSNTSSTNNQSQEGTESVNEGNTQESGQSLNNEEEQQPTQQYAKITDNGIEFGFSADSTDGAIMAVTDGEGNIIGHRVVPKDNTPEAQAEYLKNTKLFDYEEGVSLIDNNYKVQTYPTIDNNGNLTKGRIIKVTTQGEEQQNGEGTLSSSTGGSTSASTTSTTSTTSTVQAFDAEQFTQDVQTAFRGKVDFNTSDEDIDSLAEAIKAKISEVRPEIKADYVADEVDKYVNQLKAAFEKVRKFKGIERAAGNLNTVAQTESYAARVEETDTRDYSPMFAKAMESFVEEYAKTLIVPTSEGKQIINLQDILRICQSTYGNNSTQATNLYELCKSYLLSDEGKAKYIVEDIDEVVDGSVVDKSFENVVARQNEIVGGLYSARVDIRDIINVALDKNLTSDEDRKSLFEALDNLKAGDKVTLYAVAGELVIKAKDSNGKEVTIGKMPKPNVFADGRYMVFNEGWATDVKIGANGEIESEFRDLVKSIFLNDGSNPVLVELRQIIIDASVHGMQNKYIKAFANNKLIDKLVVNSSIENDYSKRKVFIDRDTAYPNYEAMLNHLVKLWKFCNVSDSKLSLSNNVTNINVGLNLWFNKLYNSYNSIAGVNSNQEVTVSKITEGQLNRKLDNVTDANKSELPHAKDGIKDISNARISVVDPQGTNSIIVSGKERIDCHAWKPGSTIMTIYNRNGKPDYVKAIAVNFSTNENNPAINKIGNAVATELNNKLNDFFLGNTNGSLDELEIFFKQLIRNKGNVGSIPLLAPKNTICTIAQQDVRNTRTNTIDHCLQINFYNKADGSNQWIRIYNTSFGNANAKKIMMSNGFRYDFHNQAKSTKGNPAYTAISMIQSLCNFAIDGEGIKMDNQADSSNVGFITKKNGKVGLNIGDEKGVHETYDSYNDFLVNNNLVRVNTYIDENGSNYNRTNTVQGAAQNMYIDIPTVNTQTSKSSKGKTERIERGTDKAKYDTLKESLNSDSQTKGEDLVRLAFGDEWANQFNKAAKTDGISESLFPTKIYYDDINWYSTGKPKGSLAATNSRGNNSTYEHIFRDGRKTIRVQGKGNTVIGSRLLNMLASTNGFRRNTAARKLIHERIHQILADPDIEKLNALQSVADIYKQVKDELKKEAKEIKKLDANNPANKVRIALYNDVKSTLSYKDSDLALEEFIVESMTNASVARFMDNIKVDDVGEAKGETLLSKIMKFISKFFGWNISDDSLLRKEFNILSNLEAKPTNETEAAIAEEVHEENKKEDEALSSPPVEDTTADESPATSEEIANLNEDFDGDEGGLTLTDDDLDFEIEDDEALFANVEESNLDFEAITDSQTHVASMPHLIKRLDTDNQANMQELINSGYASMKCS